MSGRSIAVSEKFRKFSDTEKVLATDFDLIGEERTSCGSGRTVERNISDSIIKMLFERDEKALEEIQSEFGRLIKSIVFNLTGSDIHAEECLNDTLFDIWNTIPPNELRSIASYACMIARRRAIDKLRGELAQKRVGAVASEYSEVYCELADMEDFYDALIDRIELAKHINAYLAKLSPENREIFLSRYFDFESIGSIAKRLRISENSVNTRLFRMRKGFKEKLLKEGYQNE